MYINTKKMRDIESLCLIANDNHFYRSHERFGFGRQFDNSFNEKKKTNRYNIENIKSEHDLKFCLGFEFLDCTLAMSLINESKNMSHFFDDILDTPHNSKRFIGRNGSRLELRFMIFNHTMTRLVHICSDFISITERFDYTELVMEWLSFGKKHNIDLSDVFAPISPLIEKNKKDRNEHKSFVSAFNLLQKEVREVMDDIHDSFYKTRLNSRYGNMGIHEREMLLPFIHNMSLHNQMSGEIDQPDSNGIRDTLSEKLMNEFELTEKKTMDFARNFKDYINFKIKDKKKSAAADLASYNTLLQCISVAYEKMKDKIKLPEMQATRFILQAERFMSNNQYDKVALNTYIENNKESIDISVTNFSLNNNHYKHFILFNDRSCAALRNGQEVFEQFVNIVEMKDMIKSSMVAYLKNMLRKNPTMAKCMANKFEENIKKINEKNETRYNERSLHYDKMLLCIDTYFKNENILKSLKFSFIDNIEKLSTFEKVDDKMHKLIRDQKIKKYADSIVSNKYKPLYNAKSYKLFKELYDLKIDEKIVQEMIGKKLAAVDSKEMLNESIRSLINSFNNFNIDAIKIKVGSTKANIISEQDNILIIEIGNFEQSKALGSASWCISRSPSYFEQYTENGAKQYFIYDFNQSSKSVKSLIGVTLSKKMTVKAAHSKSDAALRDKTMVEYLIEKLKDKEEKVKEVEAKPAVVKQARKKKEKVVNDLIIGF